MNVFELLTVIAILAAGYFCGRHFGLRYALVGWVGGFIAGSLLAVLAYCAFRKIIGVTRKKDQAEK